MSTVFILEDLLPAQRWLSAAVRLAVPNAEVHCFDELASGLAWLADHDPLLCLVDLKLPDGSGIDCIRACKALSHKPPVLVITMYDDDLHLLPALKAGADGYLLKEEPQEVIAHAIRDVLHQRPALSSPITARLMQIAQAAPQAVEPPPCPLTLREQAILQAIAKGYRTSEVAELLSISPHTAAKHLKNIYAKLGIHSRMEAVTEAMRFGLLNGDIPKIGDSPTRATD